MYFLLFSYIIGLWDESEENRMKTSLAQELSLARTKTKYDTQCKKILSQKIILAWILKYTVSEFAAMDISEIYNCIEGPPEISAENLLPGAANIEKITGMTNEDKIAGEGRIYYDIRFAVVFPSSDKYIRLLINLEAQSSFYPGYQIVTRGIFYDARMISAQLGTEFSIPHYDNIKKVYSIWICLDAPNYIGNAISDYHMTKTDLSAGIPDNPWTYDKISIVLITLNEKVPAKHKLLHLLNVLFSPLMPYEEKRKILETEYSICMEYDEGKELNLMCNVSDYVVKVATEIGLQKGMEQGLEKGLEQGLEQGLKQGRQEIVEKLLRIGLLSDDIIANLADYSIEKIQEMKKKLDLMPTAG